MVLENVADRVEQTRIIICNDSAHNFSLCGS
jgi:hypothetical protein